MPAPAFASVKRPLLNAWNTGVDIVDVARKDVDEANDNVLVAVNVAAATLFPKNMTAVIAVALVTLHVVEFHPLTPE